ncbi:MAG: 3-phosphoshikimate 1-carboxyvinyltransferase [Bdellovibrionales bacterium]
MDVKIKIPSSKSLVNRYLILKEGFSNLSLDWDSEAEDVLHLKKALEVYKSTREIYIGEGGTTLRFLAVYLSSQKGSWVLEGAVALFKRPQDELVKTLKALGAKAVIKENKLFIESVGWQVKEIEVDALKTTQVLTGLILAALASGQELRIKLGRVGMNSDYLQLTKRFIESLGFRLEFKESEILIFKDQVLEENITFTRLESDWSSAAFIYVLAAVLGRAEILGLMEESFQPDSEVLRILKSAGVSVLGHAVEKPVYKGFKYKPIDVNLQKCPDLFPVLSVFSCFCDGESVLYGAPQLVYKESNRIKLISNLLTKCGYKVSAREDGLKIQGENFKVLEHEEFSFDASSDHRIFMACEIFKKAGYRINIKGAESIKKSFPEYLKMDVS